MTNTVEELIENVKENEVIVTNIHYFPHDISGKPTAKRNDLPESFVLDLPERILEFKDKDEEKYKDLMETFCYNTISKKFQAQIANCQVWYQ